MEHLTPTIKTTSFLTPGIPILSYGQYYWYARILRRTCILYKACSRGYHTIPMQNPTSTLHRSGIHNVDCGSHPGEPQLSFRVAVMTFVRPLKRVSSSSGEAGVYLYIHTYMYVCIYICMSVRISRRHTGLSDY